jgi:E3 ubiquitin-protein ligase SIAH1
MADAVKVPCSNAYYGRKELIIYHQKEKHVKTCVHAPCFCPEDGCSFKGSTGLLLDHFVTKHKWSPKKFSYDKTLKIYIPRNHRFTLLVGEDQSMFLMVNTPTDTGSALTTICIRPHESLGSCYLSKFSAVHRAEPDKRSYVFQMDPHVGSSSLHDGDGVKLGLNWEGSLCWCLLN